MLLCKANWWMKQTKSLLNYYWKMENITFFKKSNLLWPWKWVSHQNQCKCEKLKGDHAEFKTKTKRSHFKSIPENANIWPSTSKHWKSQSPWQPYKVWTLSNQVSVRNAQFILTFLTSLWPWKLVKIIQSGTGNWKYKELLSPKGSKTSGSHQEK